MTIEELEDFLKKSGKSMKELAEGIGYNYAAISQARRTKHVSRPMGKAIKLYEENIFLKRENRDLKNLKNGELLEELQALRDKVRFFEENRAYETLINAREKIRKLRRKEMKKVVN